MCCKQHIKRKHQSFLIRTSSRDFEWEFGFMCQYDRKLDADTVWSVIYDIKNKKIYRVEGNPSRKIIN